MEILLFLLLCFSFNLIQVIAAFGGTMLAMPFAILMFGALDAKLILNGVSIIGCMYPILRCWKQIRIVELKKIALFMLIGAGLAQIAGPVLYSDTILFLYSIMVLIIGIINLLPKREIHLPKIADYITLLLAGLIQGAFLSGGSLLAVYSMKNFKEKDQMRGTISAIWLIINSFVMVSSILAGAYTPEITKMVLIGLVPAAMGLLLGDWLQSKLDQKKFRKFVNIMLLISGFVLLYNCISS